MIKTVRDTIERSAMLTRGDHVLVAVSGGPDSMALLRVLALLSPVYQLHLTTAHLNHGLRGAEARAEGDFVLRVSGEMGIACVCTEIDIRSLQRGSGRSLEEIGREERYRFLHETADRCGAQRIATGHHRNDQAETILINLIRGSGPEGLRGIAPVRGRVIRPLLDVTREEIIGFLRTEGLPYRVDSSNIDPRYLRNRIRSLLIPDLEVRFNPQIIHSLSRTAHIVRREDDYLQETVNSTLQAWGITPGAGDVRLPCDALLSLHEAIRARIVKSLLAAAAAEGAVAMQHVEAVLRLARSSACRPRSLDLPCLVRVAKQGAVLSITRSCRRKTRSDKSRGEEPAREYLYPVDLPGTVYVAELDRLIRFEIIENPGMHAAREAPGVAFIDYARLIPPLFVRNAKHGERFNPLGMTHTKKISSFFADRKVTLADRARIPLLVDSRSVIWIAGESISDRVKISQKTAKVVRAEMV